MSDWISVKEKLPFRSLPWPHKRVLVYIGKIVVVGKYLRSKGNERWVWAWNNENLETTIDKVTHWMSLPATPKK